MVVPEEYPLPKFSRGEEVTLHCLNLDLNGKTFVVVDARPRIRGGAKHGTPERRTWEYEIIRGSIFLDRMILEEDLSPAVEP